LKCNGKKEWKERQMEWKIVECVRGEVDGPEMNGWMVPELKAHGTVGIK
jgi:hypothetical protein